LLGLEQEEKYSAHLNGLKHLVHAQPHTHIVIDEIKKAPKLLDFVHYLNESTDKYFIMTGSSARKIKRGGPSGDR
jgi:predicted AAA+ superfamily ATPase